MPNLPAPNPVTEVPAASSARAVHHFSERLEFETDCWDVHDAITRGRDGFVVLDVRGPELYAAGRVPTAVSLPHGRITADSVSRFGDVLFVVYCAGPHCNGADRAALRLARLGRPVKKMIGGITGWSDEGFDLAT